MVLKEIKGVGSLEYALTIPLPFMLSEFPYKMLCLFNSDFDLPMFSSTQILPILLLFRHRPAVATEKLLKYVNVNLLCSDPFANIRFGQ